MVAYLYVCVLLQESSESEGDSVANAEASAYDAESLVNQLLLPQLHVKRHRTLVMKIMPRYEATDFTSPST